MCTFCSLKKTTKACVMISKILLSSFLLINQYFLELHVWMVFVKLVNRDKQVVHSLVVEKQTIAFVNIWKQSNYFKFFEEKLQISDCQKTPNQIGFITCDFSKTILWNVPSFSFQKNTPVSIFSDFRVYFWFIRVFHLLLHLLTVTHVHANFVDA